MAYKNKEDQKKWYLDNKEKIAEKRAEYYRTNKESFSKRSKKWALENPDKVIEIAQKSYTKNKSRVAERTKKRGVEKRELILEQKRKRYKSNPEYRRKRLKVREDWGRENRDRERIRVRRQNAKLKRDVISSYGGACKVCGETELEFLVLDHVNNNGAEHRKEPDFGASAYRWAKRNGFPNTLQILCHNHNSKKERELKPSGDFQKQLKGEALKVYGESCQCCGEPDPDMLHLDHINGGGTKHCRDLRIKNLPRWAKRNNWPNIFRTLCANCNFSAYRGNGVCIHKRPTFTISPV